MKYRILSAILSLIVSLNLCSCDSENENYIFKSVIYGNPKTLDPQCALQDSSYSVIYNVFQGLFSFNENGETVNGMIDSYEISDDGKTWTFMLEEGIKWSDGDKFEAECTAEDYVFAFQRLLKPSTKSKRASEYYIIKNARSINNGDISDLSELGVIAKDKYILELTLEEPCSDLKALLALPPAMPCNEEFYTGTQGRYGLDADCVASNNNYYVYSWNYDEWSDDNNYFILRRNSLNNAYNTLPTGINFFINSINEFGDFDNEILHTYTGYSEKEIPDLMKKYHYSEHSSGIYGFIFNHNGSFSELDYRLELAQYIKTEENYGIVPECVTIDNNNYRQLADDVLNIAFHHKSDVGVINDAKLILPEFDYLSDKISDVIQKWQSECNFYCNIVKLDTVEYLNALQNGDFDIALIELSGEYNSPYAYLNDFLDSNSQNYSGYSNKKFNHIINSAFTASDSETAAIYYKEAEQLLIDNAVFVPLSPKKKYVFYSDKVSNVYYNPFLDIFSFK